MHFQVQFAVTKHNSIVKTLRVKVIADDAIDAAKAALDLMYVEEKMKPEDKYQLKVSII